MPTIVEIRETEKTSDGFKAEVRFDGGAPHPITVHNPFDADQEKNLEWYFEKYFKLPFLETVRARNAAESLTDYGHQLFAQLFQSSSSIADTYKNAARDGLHALKFHIAGSPAFHELHWELLKDPTFPRPFATTTSVVRKNFADQDWPAVVQQSNRLNILLVTARPGGREDVGYRTIGRVLQEAIDKSILPIDLHQLRPGTWKAFLQHLDEKGPGFYHMVHFDLHGALLNWEEFLEKRNALEQSVGNVSYDSFGCFASHYGRGETEAYEGYRAFLAFETDDFAATDPAPAEAVAEQLTIAQIPVVILNACQVGRQRGNSESSIGAHLMRAGMQFVVAMRYSVLVTAAQLFMEHFYRQALSNKSLSEAVRYARLELSNNINRRAFFNYSIELHDWMLPVVYQNTEVYFKVEVNHNPGWYEEEAHRRERRKKLHQPRYGFIGRDLDLLSIERRLLRRNHLLIHSAGGAGKTSLLTHAASWWLDTRFVKNIFYFGYDQQTWTIDQIIYEIAKALGGVPENFTPKAYSGYIIRQLRANRFLLILDNLESIHGGYMAIGQTLSSNDQQKLKFFLEELTGGNTFILYGSRSTEDWLSIKTFETNIYELQNLDQDAASELAANILARNGIDIDWKDTAINDLLSRLNGFPLALEVIVPKLKNHSASDILTSFQSGDDVIDFTSDKKNESMLRCVEYSFSHLSSDAQNLLITLAPFSNVINVPLLPLYSECLKNAGVSNLSTALWDTVLNQARNGLMSNWPELPHLLRLQPVLPYFLRNRLLSNPALKAQIDRAFVAYYNDFGKIFLELTGRERAESYKIRFTIGAVHQQDFSAALKKALDLQTDCEGCYLALAAFHDMHQNHEQAIAFYQLVTTGLKTYPNSSDGIKFADLLLCSHEDLAFRFLKSQHHEMAKEAYLEILNILLPSLDLPYEQMQKWITITHEGLGNVAENQGLWDQAEHHYQQVLDAHIELRDGKNQARIYNQLGILADKRHHLEQAESYYKQALAINIELNERQSQATNYYQLGYTAFQQGQLEQANQHLLNALPIFIEFNDREKQAGTYHVLGMVAAENHDFQQAQHNYQEALVLQIELNNRVGQSITYNQLGLLAQKQRQWEQAEIYFLESLYIKLELKNFHSAAFTLHNLGMVAAEQRKWQQADAYYQEALSIKIKFNDHYSQASTYHALGKLAHEQRQWQKASDYYYLALKIYAQFKDMENYYRVYDDVGRLERDSGQDPSKMWARSQMRAVMTQAHKNYDLEKAKLKKSPSSNPFAKLFGALNISFSRLKKKSGGEFHNLNRRE